MAKSSMRGGVVLSNLLIRLKAIHFDRSTNYVRLQTPIPFAQPSNCRRVAWNDLTWNNSI